jgi:gliding motility-associated-like protein
LDSAFFDGYRLEMNEAVDGSAWQNLRLVGDWQDTLLQLAPFNPRLEARDFRVVLQVRENPDCPPGDSIANILLENADGQLADTNAMVAALAWSAYDKAAPDPTYQLFLIFAGGDSLLLQSGTGRTFLYTKPLEQGSYRLVVTAQAPTDPHGSRSNELAFEIPRRELHVFNVITPNGDGFNDFLTIRNILYHPAAELWVYNRWGQEVFAAVGYQNDWSPTTLEAGNYVYRLRIPEQPELNGMLRIVK